MASLELRNETYRVVFMYRGRKYGYSLDTGDKQTAEALRGGVEHTLMLIGMGALAVPEGSDLVQFVRTGGKIEQKPEPAPERVTFADFTKRYLDAHRGGAMEEGSLQTVAMHLGHFERTLGARFAVASLTLSDLQGHVTRRRQKKYRGKPLSPVTLKKEVASLSAAWNWARQMGLVQGPFPSKGLVYPKRDEKPPFQTWPEIERKIALGQLPPEEQEELWDCLYLRTQEITELLEYVKANGTQPWVYPLVCTASHTGARRSELLRIEIADVDFDVNTILIREKKRSREKRTTRHVPLPPFLKQVLQDWLKEHPGGRSLFAPEEQVHRSKKRSRTTGHRSEKTRATSLKGRLADVKLRERPGVGALTRDEAHDHFKRTLAGSKWQVLRGFHVLRHSYISCLAAAGVDQRIIDDAVGHQTEEQRKRYRHLLPDVKYQAVSGVFG